MQLHATRWCCSPADMFNAIKHNAVLQLSAAHLVGKLFIISCCWRDLGFLKGFLKAHRSPKVSNEMKYTHEKMT